MDYAIGFCSGYEVTLAFLNSLVNAVHRDRCGVLSMLGGPVLHRNRNELSKMFLEGQGGHVQKLVMVDTDIAFTMDDLDALLAHKEPIVSGVYPAADGRVISDGCGFMVIDREVLDRLMPYPFNPVKFEDGRISGEDVGFRVHARQAGYEVVVDPTISVQHLKHTLLSFRDGELVHGLVPRHDEALV